MALDLKRWSVITCTVNLSSFMSKVKVITLIENLICVRVLYEFTLFGLTTILRVHITVKRNGNQGDDMSIKDMSLVGLAGEL